MDDWLDGIDWDALTGGGGSFIPDLENINWAEIGGGWNGQFPDVDDEGNVNPNPNAPHVPTDPGLRGTPSVTTGFGNDRNSFINQVLRMLGITGGAGGASGVDLSKLIPLIAALYGGLSTRNAVGNASDIQQRAAGEANDQARSILGGVRERYQPYTDAGAAAASQLANQGPKNLAGNYGPMAQTAPITHGMLPAPQTINRNPISQPAPLTGNFQPLGRGVALSQLGRR